MRETMCVSIALVSVTLCVESISLIPDGPVLSLNEAFLPGFPAVFLGAAARFFAGAAAIVDCLDALARGFPAAAGFIAFFVFFTLVPSS